MTDVDFTTLMTTEQVAQARRGGEIVRQHRTGEKLRQQFEEAFAVGTGLLIGRVTAMRAANTSEPGGRPYVEAFGKWKKDFGYIRTGKMSTAYFDDCLVIASHRELAEQIVAGTSEDERFAFGLSMLAKQTRQRVRDLENAKRREEDERPAAPSRAATATYKDTKRGAPQAEAVTDPSHASERIANLVLAYEARTGRFPTADEIVEALEIGEADAAKGLDAVVKARKVGGAQPIQFSEAQVAHVKAWEETLKRREEALKRHYYKITEAEQRKLVKAQREAFIDIEARAQAIAGDIRQFAFDKLHEWAESHGVFDASEWRLLNMAIQSNASDETRHKAAQLLNERAFLATGGKMGKPDAIARAKQTRAEAEAEKAAKRKATREANKAVKAAEGT